MFRNANVSLVCLASIYKRLAQQSALRAESIHEYQRNVESHSRPLVRQKRPRRGAGDRRLRTLPLVAPASVAVAVAERTPSPYNGQCLLTVAMSTGNRRRSFSAAVKLPSARPRFASLGIAHLACERRRFDPKKALALVPRRRAEQWFLSAALRGSGDRRLVHPEEEAHRHPMRFTSCNPISRRMRRITVAAALQLDKLYLIFACAFCACYAFADARLGKL
ncbi:unnamed protein product [Soboliphyme baturini]|uniref:Uncharacterized protein n=1 Tax=Soboliphyme baturini TaxID=241478 RepID=A0A183IZK9_9BILA|nr:unnamed protein product [Soboliphyme baturini]